MIKMDINLSDGEKHICVEHEIDNMDAFAEELIQAIDLIVSEKVLSMKELTPDENVALALLYRRNLLEKMICMNFSCPECYEESDLIMYAPDNGD